MDKEEAQEETMEDVFEIIVKIATNKQIQKTNILLIVSICAVFCSLSAVIKESLQLVVEAAVMISK